MTRMVFVLFFLSCSAFADLSVKATVRGKLWDRQHCSFDMQLLGEKLQEKCKRLKTKLDQTPIGIKVFIKEDVCQIEGLSFCEG
ncbi:MAG: hypothetical protein D6797_00030 [Bdellovibrio sp.]|nr:MAG: hypothetical protein D6797_00030 [Bdellovibrio sp.]